MTPSQTGAETPRKRMRSMGGLRDGYLITTEDGGKFYVEQGHPSATIRLGRQIRELLREGKVIASVQRLHRHRWVVQCVDCHEERPVPITEEEAKVLA